MLRIALTLIAGAVSGLAGATPVGTPGSQGSLSAQQILEQFNLVTLGNVTSSSHVDGRSFIGGSVSGGDYVQHPADVAASAYAGLTVAGSASALNVNGMGAVVLGSLSHSNINSGNTFVGGAVTASNINGSRAYVNGVVSGSNINATRLSSLSDSAPLSAAVSAANGNDLGNTLKALSSSLSSLKSTGSSVVFNGGKATFNAVADANGLAVFDLTAGNLDELVFAKSEFEFKFSGAKTVIINVDELNVVSKANFLGGSAQRIAGNVIWNFYKATDITLDSQFGGSILASSAKLTNFNNIEGAVLVSTLDQRGEIHANRFTGNVSIFPDVVKAIPEPETLPMLFGGLALLATFSRRRHAA